jgi:hypothetical protein
MNSINETRLVLHENDFIYLLFSVTTKSEFWIDSTEDELFSSKKTNR